MLQNQGKWKIIEKYVLSLVFVFILLFVSFIFFARWPQWWEWTVPEMSPMTWMESLLLFLITIMAIQLSLLSYLKNEKSKLYWWSLLALGFFYLTLDERFALHERLRDKFLAPQHIRLPFLSWISDGDFILVIYLILGLLLGIKYLRLFKERLAAFRWFIIGVIFSALAVLIDSFNFKAYSLIIQRWQQFSEELLEIVGMFSFFAALFLLLSFRIQNEQRD